MTEQDAFNRVWQWFIVERHPKSSNGARCLYRHEVNGVKTACAVGCLLSDEAAAELLHYNPSVEGIARHGELALKELAGVELTNDGLLSKLQIAHDDTAKPWNWYEPRKEVTNFHKDLEVSLRLIAAKFRLTVPITV